MLRFFIIFLVCVSVAPFLPGLIEKRLGERAGKGEQVLVAATERPADGGGVHRIPVNRHGQYIVEARANGRSIDMLVDTGATMTALSESIAEKIGIYLRTSDFTIPVNTANGTTYGARAVIDALRIGNVYLEDIDAIVLDDRSLGGALLGMSALGKLEGFDISGGTLELVQ